MRKVFLALLVLTVIVTAKFIYARAFVQQILGPTSMLAAVLLFGVILAFAVSFAAVDGSHREKVLGFWMVSLSTAITYVAVDLILGAFLITPLSPTLVPDDIRHHKLVPDAYAKFQQQDFSYVQRNNALGLRGDEVSVTKPNGTFRVITLGDSFTMGKGVEDDQTFSVLLERHLNDQLQRCKSEYGSVEVVNGGVDSYSPILSYLYLKSGLLDLDPDLVILNLDNSDLVQESAYRGVARKDDSGKIIAVPGEQVKKDLNVRVRTWIEGNMYMTRLLLYYVNKWMGFKDMSVRGVVTRANTETLLHTLKSDSEDRSSQWADVFESLTLIRELLNRHSSSFVLSLYPWAHQVSANEWVPGRQFFLNENDEAKPNYDETIMQLADQYEIDSLSTYAAFLHYDGDEPLYFANDMHFTVRGHEVMAADLVRQLMFSASLQALCN